MEIDTSCYPEFNKKHMSFALLRNLILLLLGIGLIACGIINLCIGGKPWFFIVLLSEFLFWLIFEQDTVDTGFINKILMVTITVCGLLWLIDSMYGNIGWANRTANPIIAFSSFILISILFFSMYKRQKQFIFTIYSMATVSMLLLLFGIVGTYKITWGIIVLGSYALAFLIVSSVIYRKSIGTELKKYFHT